MPTNVFPPFEPQVPVWPHTDLYSFSEYFEDKYEEPVLSRVLNAAASHETALAQVEGLGSGLLWIPNPEDGVPFGGGYLRVFESVEPMSIDQILEERDVYYPRRKEKVHQYDVERAPDLVHGPAGVQYLISTFGRSTDLECSLSVWVVPEPHTAIEAHLTFLDPLNNEAASEALMRFISLSKVEVVA